MSRDVGVPMQHNVNAVWWVVRRYMLQAKFQSAPHQINNHRPFEITIAISAHDRDWRLELAKLVEDRFGADVPQVPNFIRAFSHFTNPLRQTIVRIREHENTPRVFL
jgi:hypothetical protein